MYLKFGGLPAIHELGFSEEVAFQYLHTLFNTILYKDVVTRHRIRDASMLDRIARFAFDNCGSVVSAQKIAEYMKSQRIKIAEKPGDKRYFQVCYLPSGAATEARDFGSLSEINDNHPKSVLSMDKEWGLGRDGIRRTYLPDFLLGKD